MRRTRLIALVMATAAAVGAVGAYGIATVSSTITPPPAGASFDTQLGGSYTPPKGVRVLERDWHTAPAAGLYNICYVDVFQTQPEAATYWKHGHPGLLLQHDGRVVEDAHWPGQYLLDTSTAAKRTALVSIEEPWIATCARKGFDAVEFDNLDSWTRSDGALTAAGNLALAGRLAARAHQLHLAVAQKNAPTLGSRGRDQAGFDFAITESCQQYAQCGAYTRAYGAHVIEIEYSDTPRSIFTAACAARGSRISIVLRDRLVSPKGSPAYRYAHC